MSSYLSKRAWVAVAGLALALCVGMPAQAAGNAATSLPDSAVTAKVVDGLTHQESLRGADINVKTVKGVVTLTGTVSDFHAKAIASTVAIDTEGVRILKNDLTLAPPRPKSTASHSTGDDRITADVRQVLADSLAPRYKVNVKTVDGVVYLTGDLSSQASIDRISGLVAKVDGVKHVNTLGLDYPYVVVAY